MSSPTRTSWFKSSPPPGYVTIEMTDPTSSLPPSPTHEIQPRNTTPPPKSSRRSSSASSSAATSDTLSGSGYSDSPNSKPPAYSQTETVRLIPNQAPSYPATAMKTYNTFQEGDNGEEGFWEGEEGFDEVDGAARQTTCVQRLHACCCWVACSPLFCTLSLCGLLFCPSQVTRKTFTRKGQFSATKITTSFTSRWGSKGSYSDNTDHEVELG